MRRKRNWTLHLLLQGTSFVSSLEPLGPMWILFSWAVTEAEIQQHKKKGDTGSGHRAPGVAASSEAPNAAWADKQGAASSVLSTPP